jgi:hypothetical protein
MPGVSGPPRAAAIPRCAGHHSRRLPAVWQVLVPVFPQKSFLPVPAQDVLVVAVAHLTGSRSCRPPAGANRPVLSAVSPAKSSWWFAHPGQAHERLLPHVVARSRLASSSLDTSTLDSAAHVEIAITPVPKQYANLAPEP